MHVSCILLVRCYKCKGLTVQLAKVEILLLVLPPSGVNMWRDSGGHFLEQKYVRWGIKHDVLIF